MGAISHWVRGHISLVAIVAVVLGLGCAGLWAVSRPQETALSASELGDTGLLPEAEQIRPTEVTTILVYISGAVHAPDVYVLPTNARVKDLVVAAGGFTDEADPDAINLADKLSDAQHIRVAKRGATAASTGGTAETSDKLDLNTASANDLEELPGIGAALAERIIAYRTENGPLKQVADLQKVKGIGGSLYDKIEPLVTVGS